MAGEGYYASFGGLDGVVQRVGAINNQVTSEIQECESAARQLEPSWDGAAKAQYQQLRQRWNTAASNMQNMLGAMQSGLNGTNVNYSDTESSIAKMWAQ